MMKKIVITVLSVFVCVTLSFTQSNEGTKVILLGTGTPNPDPAHTGPAVVVLTDSVPYLFDFGSGVVRNVAAMSPQWGGEYPGMAVKNLKIAFLTHLHSDHTTGLADLILTPWVMGRETPLEIFGPEGITKMVHHLLLAYREDIRYRIYGTQPANDSGWRVNTHEIIEGIVYRDNHVSVRAFPVQHGTWPNAYGYRIETGDKVIVISGDTRPCESLLKYGQGVDILVHEVYSMKGYLKKDAFWQKYHSANHTSTYELADVANKLKPQKLVLYHILFWGATSEDILSEIRRTYDGEVIVGQDRMVIE